VNQTTFKYYFIINIIDSCETE